MRLNKIVVVIVLLISCRMLASSVVNGNGGVVFNGEKYGMEYLNIPARPSDAATGSEFAARVSSLNLEQREKEVVKEILLGNVPSFSRKLKPVTTSYKIDMKNYELTFFTLCDYMAIGSDDDYLYIPMTPSTAQYLADRLDCSLPTKKMVDIIYNDSDIKLYPQPIPPSDKMTTIPVFKQHTDSVKKQIAQIGFDRTADYLIAGHKKDVIISNKIYSTDRDYERVVIYGWHRGVNDPIQPVYNGHIAAYADYSHGIRLTSNTVILNGDSLNIRTLLQDPELSKLLSSEGVINKPYYPPSDWFTSVEKGEGQRTDIGFKLNQNYPNPFNPSTTISYGLSLESRVKVEIYNICGERIDVIANEVKPAGLHSAIWNAAEFASGIYVAKISAVSVNDNIHFTKSMKMILMK